MSYTTTLSVVQVAGIGVQVENEVLGTGDNANKSFDVAEGNIIADSYTLQYGTATGNDTNTLTALTETTHYTLTKDSGVVLLTASGVTELGTDVLYISYTHSPKSSDTTISTYFAAAEKEVDRMTSNYWGVSAESIETFDWEDEQQYPTTDEPYIRDYDPPEELQLKKRGIISITSIEVLANDGSVQRTLTSTQFRFTSEGRIIFFTTLPNGYDNIKITYQSGYDATPADAKELTDLVIALRILAAISAGSYDDATGFTLGRKQVQVGEVYINIAQASKMMQNRIDLLLPGIGPTLHAC